MESTLIDRRPRSRWPSLATALALAVAALSFATAGPATSVTSLPAIGHVWTIMLENSDFLETYGLGTNAPYTPQSGALNNPYIAQTLPSEGVLIPNYFGTGHNSLDNYITMTSGQWPNLDTKGDCSDTSVLGGGSATTQDGKLTELPDGQWEIPRTSVGGVATTQPDTSYNGCTFPEYVKSLPDQFDEKGITWKGYMEDMDASPATQRTTCRAAGSVPKPDQSLSTAKTYDGYAVKHDPFEYYHSVTDRQSYCDAHDVAQTQLATDLQSIATTPQFSYLTPNLCDDAHDTPCSNGNPGGLEQADTWAKTYVPMIMNSPAYKQDGLIIFTVDEGGFSGAEALACCGESKGPNLPLDSDNGTTNAALGDSAVAGVLGGSAGTIVGPGGGQIGTVMLSPFIKGGTLDTSGTYNHCSYLRSIEDIFGIGATSDIPGSDGAGHLACAGQAGVSAYGADVFNAPSAPPAPTTSPASPTPSPTASTPAHRPSPSVTTATARPVVTAARQSSKVPEPIAEVAAKQPGTLASTGMHDTIGWLACAVAALTLGLGVLRRSSSHDAPATDRG